MNRAEKSEQTYEQAAAIASENGMALLRTSDGCYQLRGNHRAPGAPMFIINIYPRRKGASPRCYHDPHHPGPFLRLPENWTLLDAVHAAIAAEEESEG